MESSSIEPSNDVDDSDDYGKNMRRKIKLEAVLTSGCGVGKSKQKVMNAFWKIVWPALIGIGWSKVDGTGKLAGSTFFLPKGVDMKLGRKGRDYYDRIKAVIDRVLERRNSAESKIADLYEDKVKVGDVEAERESRPKRSTPTRSSTRIDLSWKEGGRNFPKLTSRVGPEYQATDLPQAGSFKAQLDEEKHYYQIWDPARAVAKNALDVIHESVATGKKEKAIVILHNQNYSIARMDESLAGIVEENCADWSQEEKDKFDLEIFRLRKDFTLLSLSLQKSMKSCLAYYLRFFKQSDTYRLLKVVIAEERSDRGTNSDHSLDACAICGNGGSLLICDGCEGEYHIACLRPPLRSVPEGNWECDECVDKSFLEARESLIQNTMLYQRVEKRRKLDEKYCDGSDSNKEGNEMVLRPSSPVLLAVRNLAINMSNILSPAPVKREPS